MGKLQHIFKAIIVGIIFLLLVPDALAQVSESRLQAILKRYAHLYRDNNFTGDQHIRNAGSILFYEDEDNGENRSSFTSSASMDADIDYTLPAADGTSGQVLHTDGSGVLTWDDDDSGGGAPTDASYILVSNDATLTGDRAAAEGTAIDFTDGGADSTFTIGFDSTELGTTTWGSGSGIVWTFDAGASDPTITFGSGTITVSDLTCTDCIALSTETSGNYTATIADAGNSTITVVNGATEGGAVTLDAVDLNCTNCIGGTEIDESSVDHDSLLNFVANEHIDHTSVTLTAGAGLSGGGDISANRSFATDSTESDFLSSGALTCGASTQGRAQVHTTPLQYCDNAATPTLQYAAYGNSSGESTAAANDSVALGTDTTGNYVATVADAGNSTITVSGSGSESAAITLDAVDLNCTNCIGGTEIDESTVDHDTLLNFVANEHVDHTSVTLTAGAGLSGGGDISTNRSFATDSTEADFLANGALTCGASTQGKVQVHTTPLQYCDNAATPALQYAAYGNSSGESTAAANDSVALGTDTTGNYAATIADSGNSTITVTNGVAEGGAVTLDAVDLNCTNCIGGTEIDETSVDHDTLLNFVSNEHIDHTAVTLTAGAGLSGGGDISANRSFATDSTEADFLASGALTCGASTQGKAQVHTTPLQYCDNAATPTLQYAAYGNSSGESTAAANDSVALGTDTTGNYAATVADAGNSTITVTGSGSESAAITLDAVDLNCTDCLNATEIEDLYLLIAGDTSSAGYTWTGAHDYSGATIEAPNSTTLPASCTIGEIYFDNDATAGQNWYGCTAVNTWTLQGDGGGAAPDDNCAVVFNSSGSFAGDDVNLCWDNSAKELGIGTSAPDTDLHIESPAATQEEILKLMVSDSSTEYLLIKNGTGTATRFVPAIHARTTTVNTIPAMYIVGEIDATVDDSSTPAVIVDSRRSSGAALTNRELFEVRNYGTAALTVDVAGNLHIAGSNDELRFYEATNYVGFEAPALTGDQIWILPSGDSTGSQCLSSDGAGTLGWSDCGGSTSPGGSDTHVQVNQSGSFYGEAELAYDYTSNHLGIGGAPSVALDVDSNSNSDALRLRGTDATNQIFDAWVSATGSLVMTLVPGTETDQYFDIRSEDNQWGVVIRESDGSDEVAYANFYVVDHATNEDYLSINMSTATSSTVFNITSDNQVGIGTPTPEYKLDVTDSGSFAMALRRSSSSTSVVAAGGVFNDNTTNNNWAGLSFVSHDTGGTDRTGGMVAAQFTNKDGTTLDGNVYLLGVDGNVVYPLISAFGETRRTRIHGADATNDIGELYVDTAGQFILSTENSSETAAYIGADSNDNQYGFLVFESNTGTDTYGNLYTVDAATDYMSVNVGTATTTLALNIMSDNDIGIGTISPTGKFHVTDDNTGQETPQQWDVTDSSDWMRIKNATSSTTVFAPTIWTSVTSASFSSLYFIAETVTDTGSIPIMVYDARIDGGGIATRPLYAWREYGSTHMQMNADGELGIGSTSPAAKLHVGVDTGTPPALSANTGIVAVNASATGDSISMSMISGATGSASLYFGDTGDEDQGRIVYNNSTGDLGIFTAAAEVVTIDSSGNVGIGDTSPSNKLVIDSGSASQLVINDPNATGKVVAGWAIEGTQRMTIDVNDTGSTYFASFINKYGAISFSTGTAGSATERWRFLSGGQANLSGKLAVESSSMGSNPTESLDVYGDAIRIRGTQNPTSGSACNAGTFTFGSTGGVDYLYYCIASANWGRVALTTGY